MINPVPIVAAAPPADTQPPASNGEIIDKVVALGQSLILTTSTGRVMAVETGGGAVIWQTRVSSHRIDRLLANDDFVVLRVKNDEAGAIIALNTDTGDLVGRHAYAFAARNEVVNNLALGRDGSLVYVTMSQLHVVDLFDSHRDEDGLSIRASSKPTQNMALFMTCTEPDELLVHQGRIYVVSDGGQQVHSLFAGNC